MTSRADRLDVISRPNMGGVGRAWSLIVPDDVPPATSAVVGNTGEGCFGIYAGSDGWVRFISRSEQFMSVMGQSTNIHWMTSGAMLNIGGMNHPIQWLPAVTPSVRVWAPAGTYIWAEAVHVLASDTSVPLGYLHSLRV